MLPVSSLGLYIHIPFCNSKCGYCDFYSIKAPPAVKISYINALTRHMEEYAIQTKEYSFDSVYIGGGTPTSLDIKLLTNLIKQIKKNFKLSRDVEFSIESNPSSAGYSEFKQLSKSGINRLSMGLQSIHKNELTALGRTHSYNDFKNCIENAKKAKISNISADIMFGIPGQTFESLNETIEDLISCEPQHISLYGLKIEPGTLFFKNINNLNLPGEEAERDMYFNAIEKLRTYGYNQYEISNFARSGYKCRHNIRYWNCGEYIGLGTGAHSYFLGYRYSFKRSVREYIASLNMTEDGRKKIDVFDLDKYSLYDEYMEIKPAERIGEYVMLQFRLNEGLDKKDFFRRFRIDFDAMYLSKLSNFIKSGHVKENGNRYAFTPEGMFVSNYILSEILNS